MTPKKADDATADANADAAETLTVYSEGGREMYTKSPEFSYNDIYFLSNGELCLTDGSRADIYTDLGVRKFSDTFENGINAILPWDGATNYILVTEGRLKKVQLKS